MALRASGGNRWGDPAGYREFPRWTRACCALAALISSIAISASVSAGTGSLNEDQLKAAYLYNFARYVEWPGSAHAGPHSALEIGVVGSGVVSELLRKTVIGKTVGDRGLRVVEFASPAQARSSHILFIAGELNGPQLAQLIVDLEGTHVFVVADAAGFAEHGGIANFIVGEQRVRFAINQRAAENAGLKVSSKLLRLAVLVE